MNTTESSCQLSPAPEKPGDAKDAYRMLSRLPDPSHSRPRNYMCSFSLERWSLALTAQHNSRAVLPQSEEQHHPTS